MSVPSSLIARRAAPPRTRPSAHQENGTWRPNPEAQANVHLTPDQLRALPSEHQRAFEVLKALAEAGDSEGIRKIKRAAGVGNPAGYPAGEEAIGAHALRGIAEHYAKLGMPLTPTGIRAFKSERGLTGGNTIGATTAKAYARALEGKETLFRLPPDAQLSAEQRRARQVYEYLAAGRGTAGVRDLKRNLGLGNPKTTAAGAALGNEYVGLQGVTKLAEAARERGFPLTDDGIRAFKRRRGLGDDARLGPTTAARLAEELGDVGERPANSAARVDWYRRLVEQQGGTWRTGTNEVNIVGLRGFDKDHGPNANAFNRWNDTIAFAWKDANGRWQLREHRATTDPGAASGRGVPDVNGDGRSDVAHLRPGQYPYSYGPHNGQSGAARPGYHLPVFRDTNQDGRISAAEEQASRRRGDVGYGINLHWGFGNSQAVNGASLGCQVVAGTRGSFLHEISPLLRMNRGKMLYTLIDMRQGR